MAHRRTCSSKHQRKVKFNFRQKSDGCVYPDNIWEDEPLTECTKCHLSFPTDDEGYTHFITSPSHLKCDLCTGLSNASDVEEFSSTDALLAHWKQRHRIWCCEHCDLFFPDTQDHLDHIFRMHADFCAVCDTDAGTFATVELLEAHYGSAEHVERSRSEGSVLLGSGIMKVMG